MKPFYNTSTKVIEKCLGYVFMLSFFTNFDRDPVNFVGHLDIYLFRFHYLFRYLDFSILKLRYSACNFWLWG